jgi:peptidoglycan/LPS O-acetylase OafA/YrhL
MRLGDAAKSRVNGFDTLRLLGAIMVLVSHAFPLSGRPEPTVAGVTLGTLGVFIFFGISGFLVTQSWTRQPRLGPFFAKRALRILPALFALSVLTVYVVGPLVTTMSLGHYLGDPVTHAYALRNATLQTDYLLPGVFGHNPYPNAVNGSLWTLPTEARAYAAVAAIGLLAGFLLRDRPRTGWVAKHRRSLVIGFPLLAALALLVAILKVAGVAHNVATYGIALPARRELIGIFSQQWYLFLDFAVGAALYVARRRVVLRWDAFAAAIAVWLLASRLSVLPGTLRTAFLPALVVPYATLVVAFRGGYLLRKLTAWGDMSYGVYLWAFPVGQIVALKVGSSVTPGIVILVSLPLTCLLGAVSWVAVERYALRLKPGRRRPAAQPSGSADSARTPPPDYLDAHGRRTVKVLDA